jgi:hypothetical protein
VISKFTIQWARLEVRQIGHVNRASRLTLSKPAKKKKQQWLGALAINT